MSDQPEKKISVEMRIRRIFNKKFQDHQERINSLNQKKDESIEEKKSEEQQINYYTEDELNTPIEMKQHYKLHNEYEDDPNKYNIKIAFLIVATNKYDRFVQPLIESIEKYVLPKNEKIYHIFSDRDIKIENKNFKLFKIEHKPFPYPTLYRFHFFKRYFSEIEGDQLIYIDADTLIKEKIGTEILNPITLTQHCGFVNRRGTFENRLNSRCYVSRIDEKNYYGGGFYSFSKSEFEKMMNYCIGIIDDDLARGITPIWHDESAINKYMSITIPDRVLSPSYHYPENNETIYKMWGREKFTCKILLIDKNHKEIRE